MSMAACEGGSGANGLSIDIGAPEADQVVIQPIQVCDDTGLLCAQMDFLEAITDKIWAQAGLSVTFLAPNRLNNSAYLSINPDTSSKGEFYQMSFTGGAGAFGRHPSSSSDSGPINLWFVDVIEAAAGLVQYGTAWIDANGVLISDDIFDFNNGAGRLDAIAHEIGHNLGLTHRSLGAGVPNNLMSDGDVRAIPSSAADIYPDGAQLSRLTPEQIQKAQRSKFLFKRDQVDNFLSPDAAAPVLMAPVLMADVQRRELAQADDAETGERGDPVRGKTPGRSVAVTEPGGWLGMVMLLGLRRRWR